MIVPIITAFIPIIPALIEAHKGKRKLKELTLDTQGSQAGIGIMLYTMYNQAIGCNEVLTLSSLSCIEPALLGGLIIFVVKLVNRAVAKAKVD